MVSMRTVCAIALAAVVLSTAVPARADVVVAENNQTGSRDCGGGAATVSGNSNKLSFQNCSKIAVVGNDNVIDTGAAEVVSLLGNNNRINWAAGPGGRRPKVSDLGSNNAVAQSTGSWTETRRSGRGAEVKVQGGGTTVSSGDTTVRVDGSGVTVGGAGGGVSVSSGGATVATSKGNIVIDGGNLTQTHDCRGGDAVVDGGDNVLTLRNCDKVTINGSDNQVTVTGAVAITVAGNENNVTARPGPNGVRPKIVNAGRNNNVTEQK